MGASSRVMELPGAGPRDEGAEERSWQEASSAVRRYLASASRPEAGQPKSEEGKEETSQKLEAHRETLLRRVADPDASIGSRRVSVEYILELTRRERPGHINTRLLARLLQALLCEDGCHPDVWAKFLDCAASHWDLSAASLNSLRGLCSLHLAQRQPSTPGAPSPKGSAASGRVAAAACTLHAPGVGGAGAGEVSVQAGDVLSFLHTFSLRLLPSLQPGAGGSSQPSSKTGAGEEGEDPLDFDLDSDEEGGGGPQRGPTQTSSNLLHSFWALPRGGGGLHEGNGAGAGAEAAAEPQGAGKKKKGGKASGVLGGHVGLAADRAGRHNAGPEARLARLRGSDPGLGAKGLREGYSVAGGGAQKAPLDEKERARDVRRQLGAAWMVLLRCRLARSVVRAAVVKLHDVIPLLPKPLLLADVLSACYKMGGDLAVRALGALFRLITEHGLEYPQYYQQLYQLLDTLPTLFLSHGKALASHRSRFVELLDVSLSSPLLPSYVAGAFAKRLARLSLRAPTPGAVAIIALLHNLLRRHPSINKLVQRTTTRDAANGSARGAADASDSDSDMEQQEGGPSDLGRARQMQQEAGPSNGRTEGASPGLPVGVDPFLPGEERLESCRALKSSLWEIDTLRHHYAPSVSRFAASLEADLTQRRRTADVRTGDVAVTSFDAIFTEEQERKIRGVPLAYHATPPASLFSSAPSLREVHGDSAAATSARTTMEALGWQVCS